MDNVQYININTFTSVCLNTYPTVQLYTVVPVMKVYILTITTYTYTTIYDSKSTRRKRTDDLYDDEPLGRIECSDGSPVLLMCDQTCDYSTS